MKYYLIAGEASGDMHGANLMKALLVVDPHAEFRYWGGDRMKKVAPGMVKHFRDTAYMGFLEVIKNLKSIFQNLEHCKRDLEQYDPDYVVFIDYPGFNIRIAKWAKRSGLRAKRIYYISPQVWAWKANRANTLRDILDAMFVILPFEESFYGNYGFKVSFVGHPLLDHLESLKNASNLRQKYGLSEKPIIALLPGSRQQEIKSLLDTMLRMVPKFSAYQFIVAAVSSVPDATYSAARKVSNVTIVVDDTNLVLGEADGALIASGTATLEAALMGVPMVVCYRGGFLNYQIAKGLIDVKYISLVNLILNKELVTELIQNDLTEDNLRKNLELILSEKGQVDLKAGYLQLNHTLGGPGASAKVARGILDIKPG